MTTENATATAGSASSQWTRPASRPEHIDQLISGVDRYNPQNLAVLTEYLEQQLQNGEYDCLANLAILKLFQFNPQDFEYPVVISVLLKALTAAPLPDFNLCLSLLGEAPVSTLPTSTKETDDSATDEQKEQDKKTAEAESKASLSTTASAGNLTDPMIVKLATLSSFLHSARFREFWKTFESSDYGEVREFAKGAFGFEDDVRRVALNSVEVAFRTISVARLASYLNLSAAELAQFIEKQAGWSIKGDLVHVPANADNDVKATTIREDVQLDQLTKLLSQSQTPVLRA